MKLIKVQDYLPAIEALCDGAVDADLCKDLANQ